jgi:site-specific DNA recombinase
MRTKTAEMKKVAIMCRVSSDEQAKGYSLDDQYEKLVNYCNRNNYEIVYEIKEDHSAKSFDRPEWKKWIDSIKKRQVKVDEILFTSWDRFARDMTGALNMIEYLKRQKIVVQSIEQPIDYNIPENLFMLAIYLANPDVDNQRRSIKVRGGIRQGLKQGRWPRPPVYGFKSAKDENGTHIIVHEPSKAPVVLEIFEGVANGLSQKEIRTNLESRNIIVSRNNMCSILKNVLYMGKIIVPADENESLQIIEAIHEPIVSEDLFYKVQQILTVNKKAKGKFIPKYAKLRDDFHLRGVINCNTCNNTMTASFSKGKLGKRYGYYHCNHCKEQRVSAIKVHEAFDKLIHSIVIEPEIRVIYDLILEEQMGGSEKQNKQEVKKLQEQLNQINDRLERLQDLMLDQKLDPDEYVSIKARYSAQKDEIKTKINGLKASTIEFSKLTQTGLNLLSNIAETYYNASIRLKHKIVGSIFFENFTFDGKKCRTPKLNTIFDLFTRIDTGCEQKKRGQMKDFFQLSPTAERGGFEPPVHFWRTHAFQACSFSHSDTSP